MFGISLWVDEGSALPRRRPAGSDPRRRSPRAFPIGIVSILVDETCELGHSSWTKECPGADDQNDVVRRSPADGESDVINPASNSRRVVLWARRQEDATR